MSQIPEEVLEYLKYDAKEGETYQGYTLLNTEYVEFSCGLECCGYESITLSVRLPTGEEVRVRV